MAKTKGQVTQEGIDEALSNASWDFLNKQLYELCRLNPYHECKDTVLAKVVMIGRTYSAALERRVKVESEDLTGDEYLQKAAKTIIKSDIDGWLQA